MEFAGPNQFEDTTISQISKKIKDGCLTKEGNEAPQPRNSQQNTSDTIVAAL